jgi:hypothetical protein
VHYRWEIKTGSTWYAGTDANVYLTLRGDKAAMQEIELNDPDEPMIGRKATRTTVRSTPPTWAICKRERSSTMAAGFAGLDARICAHHQR